MSSLLIKNIGTLVTGKLASPLRHADSILIDAGLIQAIGNGLNHKADHTIDANGTTTIAVPTPSATNVGQASTDAVREIVHDLFAG